MGTKVTQTTYERWLKAAYQYYHGDGGDMSDAEWDHIGKQLNPQDWPELKDTNYEPGQSLFWLKREAYPDWAKQ